MLLYSVRVMVMLDFEHVFRGGGGGGAQDKRHGREGWKGQVANVALHSEILALTHYVIIDCQPRPVAYACVLEGIRQ